MPILILFLFLAFASVAMTCGFLGANLGAAAARWTIIGTLAATCGTLVGMAYVGILFLGLMTVFSGGAPRISAMNPLAAWMAVGVAAGNVASVRLDIVRTTLFGAVVGLLAGVLALVVSILAWIARSAFVPALGV